MKQLLIWGLISLSLFTIVNATITPPSGGLYFWNFSEGSGTSMADIWSSNDADVMGSWRDGVPTYNLTGIEGLYSVTGGAVSAGDGIFGSLESYGGITFTNISVSLWVNYSSCGTGSIFRSNITGNSLFQIRGMYSCGTWDFVARTTGNSLSRCENVGTQTIGWHHFVISWDGTAGTLSCYDDATKLTETTNGLAGDIEIRGFCVGTDDQCGGTETELTGSIADVRVFNRTLTQTEVDGLYNNRSFLAGTEGNSCTYSGSGDWEINCADDCTISSAVDLLTNNVIITGTGTLTLTANIFNFTYGHIGSSCYTDCKNGGCFVI